MQAHDEVNKKNLNAHPTIGLYLYTPNGKFTRSPQIVTPTNQQGFKMTQLNQNNHHTIKKNNHTLATLDNMQQGLKTKNQANKIIFNSV